MNQLEVLSAVVTGRASFSWVPLEAGLEVMAWPAMLDNVFLSVSARTASACAAALSREGWVASLTTPKVEGLIYERADLRPEPVLLNPQRIDIASSAAVQQHAAKLLARFVRAPRDALVACGKSWVLRTACSPARAAPPATGCSRPPLRTAASPALTACVSRSRSRTTWTTPTTHSCCASCGAGPVPPTLLRRAPARL